MCCGVAESESASTVEAAHTVKPPPTASAGPCVRMRRQLFIVQTTEKSRQLYCTTRWARQVNAGRAGAIPRV